MKVADRVRRACVARAANDAGLIKDEDIAEWFIKTSRNPIKKKSFKYGPSLANIILCLITRTNKLEMASPERYTIYHFLETGSGNISWILGKKFVDHIKTISDADFEYFSNKKKLSRYERIALNLKFGCDIEDVQEVQAIVEDVDYSRFAMLEID